MEILKENMKMEMLNLAYKHITEFGRPDTPMCI